MTMNGSQKKSDYSSPADRQAEHYLRGHAKPPITRPAARIEHPSTNSVESESPSTAGYAKRKMWFVGSDVMLAVLAGAMIFFFLNVASIGVFGSALIVAGIVAALGLGHYLLWGRVFARAAVRERQRFQDQADRSETSKGKPPDEFPLQLNDRERTELLQLLEHSLPAATEGHEERGDSAAIRRELQERIRRFGA